MATSPFEAAINQICEEKGLDLETVLGTVEQAVAAAYRKDYGKPRQIIRAKFNKETGKYQIFQIFEVVDEVENEEAQVDLGGAVKFNKKAKVGDEITIGLPYHDEFGRIAAQTAKQVIIQRLKEAERTVIYNEYKDKEGEIVPASVQQIEGNAIVVNLGKSNGLILPLDQVRTEHYYVGQRLRVYLKGVEDSPRGPKILVSRSHPKLIEGLFRLEVPEIQSGAVAIIGVAREAGIRSKVAVKAVDESIDPVGSCVGQRGTRIQAILAEIGEEKIDIILWDENIAQFIANALSPAHIDEVHLDEKNKSAKVIVSEDQLSIAIGKNGQNVRLAGKIVGYEIDVTRPETGKKKTVKDVKDDKLAKPKNAAVKKTKSKGVKNDRSRT